MKKYILAMLLFLAPLICSGEGLYNYVALEFNAEYGSAVPERAVDFLAWLKNNEAMLNMQNIDSYFTVQRAVEVKLSKDQLFFFLGAKYIESKYPAYKSSNFPAVVYCKEDEQGAFIFSSNKICLERQQAGSLLKSINLGIHEMTHALANAKVHTASSSELATFYTFAAYALPVKDEKNICNKGRLFRGGFENAACSNAAFREYFSFLIGPLIYEDLKDQDIIALYYSGSYTLDGFLKKKTSKLEWLLQEASLAYLALEMTDIANGLKSKDTFYSSIPVLPGGEKITKYLDDVLAEIKNTPSLKSSSSARDDASFLKNNAGTLLNILYSVRARQTFTLPSAPEGFVFND